MPGIVKTATGCIAVLILGATIVYGPGKYSDYRDRETGNRIASKIDAFEAQHRRLPMNLEEAGIKQEQPYYQIQEPHHYILWFGRRLGESYEFDSVSRTWDTRD